MKIKYALIATICLILQGCPPQDSDSTECEKIMVCQDDRESYCDPPEEDTCIEVCHYIVYEVCWEKCKEI